ncbi:NepR family anti-sigma factor [Tateyamaria pelophila]|uniref:NepR family anti-sigma factor n=1 Tax=Tateyamaria pelophila TaxID=328415 RepID=UPI002958CF04|nr:NepR family anti-sigma factor [Tateyamaria pelophila]
MGLLIMAEHHSNERSHLLVRQALTRVYQDQIDEAVPDRFKDLLERLRKNPERETEGSRTGATGI